MRVVNLIIGTVEFCRFLSSSQTQLLMDYLSTAGFVFRRALNSAKIQQSVIVLILNLLFITNAKSQNFSIGASKSDITGPVFDVETMGYAAPAPKTGGLHQRLWARAFVIQPTNDLEKIVALVNIDLCFITIGAMQDIVQKLNQLIPNNPFTHKNIMVMATHNHNGPGGFSHYNFYNAPTKGLVLENYEIIVDGIASSIHQAYLSRVQGEIYWSESQLKNTNKNRSLEAYMNNPKDERNKYQSTTDETSFTLSFKDSDGKDIGIFNWFAVHGTSIKKDNKLITGDNKGFAAYMFEQKMFENNPDFIAAFANANGGDASPNIAGKKRNDGQWSCDLNEDFSCAIESGKKQFESSYKAINGRKQRLSSLVDYRHEFVNFSGHDLSSEGLSNSCSPAIGISMLAGSAEDGPGVGKEGQNCSTGSGPLIYRGCNVSRFLCHSEKPVVLDTGKRGSQPDILPLQLIRIGGVVIVALPGEFTTMAGRRVREHVANELDRIGVEKVVLAGYANAFSSYITTKEEYQLQHYEGASTLFGENTLSVYLKEYRRLAKMFVEKTEDGSLLLPKNIFKTAKKTKANFNPIKLINKSKLGQITTNTKSEYRKGNVVEFEFWSNNLNYNIAAKEDLFIIEKYENGDWKSYLSDNDWSNKIYYEGDRAKIVWDTKDLNSSGYFRFKHTGFKDYPSNHKYLVTSNAFYVR